MPSVTDLRLAQLFDEVKCDILTKNQEADNALKLEEISRTFLCESLVFGVRLVIERSPSLGQRTQSQVDTHATPIERWA
jgi:hypothetical protein